MALADSASVRSSGTVNRPPGAARRRQDVAHRHREHDGCHRDVGEPASRRRLPPKRVDAEGGADGGTEHDEIVQPFGRPEEAGEAGDPIVEIEPRGRGPERKREAHDRERDDRSCPTTRCGDGADQGERQDRGGQEDAVQDVAASQQHFEDDDGGCMERIDAGWIQLPSRSQGLRSPEERRGPLWSRQCHRQERAEREQRDRPGGDRVGSASRDRARARHIRR